ncbi:MAG TPA: metal ABC transporter permease [Mycobacteriales bacterium]|nr:metal ABC transporter permease [Mycobacteriales bacterium]
MGADVSFLEPAFMQRALIAALIVGMTAPAIGIFLVQRRLALMGDGIGHVALTGVALGFLLGTAPVLTAIVLAVVGAVAIELLRQRGQTSGDVALALLFYGGIAGGVLLIGLAPGGSNASLISYLFGSIASVDRTDLTVIAGLGAGVLGVVSLLRRELFAVCHDEEVARVSGLPVRSLNMVVAVTAAVTVTVAMRVVGLLLVSALMVVPVATAQLWARSFGQTLASSVAVGVLVSVGGLIVAFYVDVAPGATIVLCAIGVFLLTFLATAVRTAVAR